MSTAEILSVLSLERINVYLSFIKQNYSVIIQNNLDIGYKSYDELEKEFANSLNMLNNDSSFDTYTQLYGIIITIERLIRIFLNPKLIPIREYKRKSLLLLHRFRKRTDCENNIIISIPKWNSDETHIYIETHITEKNHTIIHTCYHKKDSDAILCHNNLVAQRTIYNHIH